MRSKGDDALYDEVCRVIGDAVLTMHDYGIEPKHIVIADLIKTAFVGKEERPGLIVRR